MFLWTVSELGRTCLLHKFLWRQCTEVSRAGALASGLQSLPELSACFQQDNEKAAVICTADSIHL